MKNRFIALLSTLAVLLVSSCVGDDPKPIVPIETGATLTAAMGSNLANQVYVDLSEGTVTSVAVNTWELAFENDGNAIRINSAKKVGVAFPESTSFGEVTSKDGLVFSYDSEGKGGTTVALTGWAANKPYILDLGIDGNGSVIGFKKFMITAKTSSSVSLLFADLDGANEISTNVSLGEGNFTYFSLIDEKTVPVEPASWDLGFTAVSLRTGAPCAALGGGAKPGVNCDIYRLGATATINSYSGVMAATDDPFADLESTDDPEGEKNSKTIESSNFETIKIANFNSLGASAAGNAIGRSWLQILAPHSSRTYKVYDFITYIVKDGDGNYYKLRFLAYKGGDNAENGHPTFEYELMAE